MPPNLEKFYVYGIRNISGATNEWDRREICRKLFEWITNLPVQPDIRVDVIYAESMPQALLDDPIEQREKYLTLACSETTPCGLVRYERVGSNYCLYLGTKLTSRILPENPSFYNYERDIFTQQSFPRIIDIIKECSLHYDQFKRTQRFVRQRPNGEFYTAELPFHPITPHESIGGFIPRQQPGYIAGAPGYTTHVAYPPDQTFLQIYNAPIMLSPEEERRIEAHIDTYIDAIEEHQRQNAERPNPF